MIFLSYTVKIFYKIQTPFFKGRQINPMSKHTRCTSIFWKIINYACKFTLQKKMKKKVQQHFDQKWSLHELFQKAIEEVMI